MKATLDNGLVIRSDKFGKHVVRQVLLNNYEPEMTHRFLSSINSESVVVDVGAGVGYYSLLAAPIAKWVVAVEPHPEQRKLLQGNIEANNLINIEVESVALWDTPDTGYIGRHKARIQEKGYPVRLARLDDMGLGQVDVVKIDVEGSEFEVLVGMQDTLFEYAPRLFIEVHPSLLRERGREPLSVSDFLDGIGYHTSCIATLDGRHHLEAYL